MGDEVYNCNVVVIGLLIKCLFLVLLVCFFLQEHIQCVVVFIIGNDYFFFNFLMVVCKVMMDVVVNVLFSLMVMVMVCNGVNFGIWFFGTGDCWFQVFVNVVEGLFFFGFGVDDVVVDLGDSVIIEIVGVGGFVMVLFLVIVKFVGGTFVDVINNSCRM